MFEDSNIIPVQTIEESIYLLRGQKVMLDKVLADLYEVENRVLLQAVKRNLDLFPEDFMFQLTQEEFQNLRSQFVISSFKPSKSHGGRRYLPYAFTEHGILMLSSVLKSDRAKRVNIEIMWAFVRMRRLLSEHQALMIRIDALEEKYDKQFTVVFEAILELMQSPDSETRQIGFRTN